MAEPTPTPTPLVLNWGRDADPLPVRAVLGPAAPKARAAGADAAPPWIDTGPAGEPFDFCAHVARLTEDVARVCEPLAHLDVSRLLFTFTQARNGRRHGLQARVTPLRFADGALTRDHGGTTFQVQRYVVDGRDQLYVVSFCLPRFLDQDFDDKIVTLFHELYHIGPAFDGDLRRHAGRYAVHTHSQKAYDAHMAELAREYLQSRPDPRMYGFLRLTHAQLCARHGSVAGVTVPRPKLVPVRARPGRSAASVRRD